VCERLSFVLQSSAGEAGGSAHFSSARFLYLSMAAAWVPVPEPAHINSIVVKALAAFMAIICGTLSPCSCDATCSTVRCLGLMALAMSSVGWCRLLPAPIATMQQARTRPREAPASATAAFCIGFVC